MPRDLEIFNRPDWFLQEEKRDENSPGYPIYYRYAITYSIAKNILENQKGKTWIEQEIKELIESVKLEKAYSSQGFIQLYPLSEDKGYVLVDQTNSYYPLMFYSSKNERDGKPRVLPLQRSLEDIRDGLEKIYDTLVQLREAVNWTEDFQKSLYCLYPSNQSSLKCQGNRI
jgi:hypothetical protein